MKNLLIFLLIAWLVITFIGFIFEAVMWLAFIGIALFIITVIYWVVRGKSSRGSSGGTGNRA